MPLRTDLATSIVYNQGYCLAKPSMQFIDANVWSSYDVVVFSVGLLNTKLACKSVEQQVLLFFFFVLRLLSPSSSLVLVHLFRVGCDSELDPLQHAILPLFQLLGLIYECAVIHEYHIICCAQIFGWAIRCAVHSASTTCGVCVRDRESGKAK